LEVSSPRKGGGGGGEGKKRRLVELLRAILSHWEDWGKGGKERGGEDRRLSPTSGRGKGKKRTQGEKEKLAEAIVNFHQLCSGRKKKS